MQISSRGRPKRRRPVGPPLTVGWENRCLEVELEVRYRKVLVFRPINKKTTANLHTVWKMPMIRRALDPRTTAPFRHRQAHDRPGMAGSGRPPVPRDLLFPRNLFVGSTGGHRPFVA